LGRGGAEEGAPRRPTEERRPWRRRGFLGGGRSLGGLRVRARGEWRGGGAAGSQGRGKGALVGEERGWRPVSGRRRAQARTRGFWPFKANQGRRGRRFGGRWRAALMAGRGQRLGRARPARLGATAARRRVAVLLSWRERQQPGRGGDGVRAQVEGASAARHREAAGQRGSEGAAAAQRGSERTRAQVPARAQSREGSQRGRERGERKRVERGKKMSTV